MTTFDSIGMEDVENSTASFLWDANDTIDEGQPQDDGWNDEDEDVYSVTLRVFMAITGAPLALLTLGLLLFSLPMFGFMHDDPSSNEFPRKCAGIFLFFALSRYSYSFGMVCLAVGKFRLVWPHSNWKIPFQLSEMWVPGVAAGNYSIRS